MTQLKNTPVYKRLENLAREDRSALFNLYRRHCGENFPGRLSEIVADLAACFHSVSEVEAALPITTPVERATSAVAERAEQSALRLERDMHSLESRVNVALTRNHSETQAISATVVDAFDKLTRLENNLGAFETQVRQQVADSLSAIQSSVKVDPVAVSAAVNAAVLDAFAPFKSAVVSAGAESIVANLAVTVESKPSRDAFGLDVYDQSGSTLSFPCANDSRAPKIDQTFIWAQPILRVLALASNDMGRTTLSNIWGGGEKGTGKTKTAEQFAARCGRPYFRINFQKFTMLEDVAGSTALVNGSTSFSPGHLLTAWSTPYAVLNLDEVSLADPGVLGFLNGLLEPGSTVSYGGKTWTRAPGVICIVSDNTFGSGDPSGRYTGTRGQSAALVDRFGMIVHFDYLSMRQEVEALVKHTGCAEGLAEHILQAINVCRSKVSTGEIIDAPSIRSVIAFIHALKVLPLEAAWNTTIAARQPAESAVALKAVFESSISLETVAKFM
jgi:MoxR-like ATPase